EDAPTNPLNVYGATKLAGEQAIQQIGGRYLIFRTSWGYGPHGKKFLFTLLPLCRQRESIRVVYDQIGAPTSSIEIANATRTIAMGVPAGKFGNTADWAGVYNMTCSGSVSWCGFARAIFSRAPQLLEGKTPAVTAIPSSQFTTPA